LTGGVDAAGRRRPDYYAVLQVGRQADQETIKLAYRRLARRYHPDLNPDPAAAPRMRAVNEAYAVLSDPARRAAYDLARFGGRAVLVPRPASVVTPPPAGGRYAPPPAPPPSPAPPD
jgi:curved DNA-binding protein CbpA